jgi:hypothetical protein
MNNEIVNGNDPNGPPSEVEPGVLRLSGEVYWLDKKADENKQ